MNILILGDVFGPPGMKAITEKLPGLIKKKKIDFVIINGENSGDAGVGITKKITEDLFNAGADVITSGNHIWDEKETIEFILSEERLLRPENLVKGSPGKGFGIFNTKNNKKVAVINLMGNIFMKKSDDAFEAATDFIKKIKLKKNADFIVLIYENEEGAGFNTNTNHVYIYDKNGQSIELKKDRKDRIAYKILDWVIN